MMTHPPAGEVLDREFLALRARLIDLAAGLDRLDRADGSLVAVAACKRRFHSSTIRNGART